MDFQYFIMNILPIKKQKEEQSDKTALKSYIISCRRRMKTEPDQFQSARQYSMKISQKNMIPMVQNSDQLSTIFTKRKRTEYSGYKKCNLSMSRIIRFKGDVRKQQQHQPLRKYQINSKNVEKLRRRFSSESQSKNMGSLQCPSRLFSDEKVRNTGMIEFKEIDKQNHIKLRDILKKMIDKHQPFQTFKDSSLPKIKEKKKLTGQEELSECDFQKYELQSERQRYGKRRYHIKVMPKKINLQLHKRRRDRSEDYSKLFNKKSGQRPSLQSIPDELQLSGWEAQYQPQIKIFFHS